MRFLVPQFIDVEDKIVGPLTLKQAIYIAGSLSICVMLFLKYGIFVALLFGSPFLFIAFLLSFVKVNGRPFINVMSSAFFYIIKSKLYLWDKTQQHKQVPKAKELPTEKETHPVQVGLTQSNLKKLAWSLDTTDPFKKIEE